MKAIIKRIARILSGIAFCISFVCLLGVSDNLQYQIIWTLSWAIVCALSAKIFLITK